MSKARSDDLARERAKGVAHEEVCKRVLRTSSGEIVWSPADDLPGHAFR